MFGLVWLFLPLFLLGLFVSSVFLVILAVLLGAAFVVAQYGMTRQLETVCLLHKLIRAKLPLPDGIRAYLQERSRSSVRHLWQTMFWLVLLLGYWIVWGRRRDPDNQLAALAIMLEQGWPLPKALAKLRGLVPQSVAFAVAAGEATGRLEQALELAMDAHLTDSRRRLQHLLLYPWGTLVISVGCILPIAFISGIAIGPQFGKILSAFNVECPWYAEAFFGWSEWLSVHWPQVLACAGIVAVAAYYAAYYLWRFRALWHLPLVGSIYRAYSRGWVLRVLAILCGAGRSMPEGLELIGGMALSGALARRVKWARRRIERGEKPAEALTAAAILPKHMRPLLESAARTDSLPGALEELGRSLVAKGQRRLERLLVVGFPLALLGVAAAVAFVELSFLLPLIWLIKSMA